MSCTAIMDLLPLDKAFTLSKSGKSASLTCSFCGRYQGRNQIKISLVVSERSGPLGLKATIENAEKLISSGSLLRVTGSVEKIAYQDRESGKEVDLTRIYALDIQESYEKEPNFSAVVMEGGVRKVSEAPIVRDLGDYRKMAFWLFSDPKSGYDREAFFSVYAYGFGEIAEKSIKMGLKERDHIRCTGCFEAGADGMISLKVYNLAYGRVSK